MADWLGAPSEVLVRVAVTTVLFYVWIFILLRLAGRRTLAQFSAFDFVVTIAIGSLVAGTVLSPEPAFAQGAVALLVLVALQMLIGWIRQHSGRARWALDFPPEEIGRDGELSLSSNPLGAQLTQGEIRSLLREKGVFDVDEVEVVILEPNGGISVRRRSARPDGPA